jgi:hypothetical protein
MHHSIPDQLRRKTPRTAHEWEIDRPRALALLQESYTRYRGLDDEMKADPAVATAYVAAWGWGYPDLPQHLQSCYPSHNIALKQALAITALQQNPRALYHLPAFLLEETNPPGDNPVRNEALKHHDASKVQAVLTDHKKQAGFITGAAR